MTVADAWVLEFLVGVVHPDTLHDGTRPLIVQPRAALGAPAGTSVYAPDEDFVARASWLVPTAPGARSSRRST